MNPILRLPRLKDARKIRIIRIEEQKDVQVDNIKNYYLLLPTKRSRSYNKKGLTSCFVCNSRNKEMPIVLRVRSSRLVV